MLLFPGGEKTYFSFMLSSNVLRHMEEISYRCLYHCRYSRELKTLCILTIIFLLTSVYFITQLGCRALPLLEWENGWKFQQKGDETLGVNRGAAGLVVWEKLIRTLCITAQCPFQGSWTFLDIYKIFLWGFNLYSFLLESKLALYCPSYQTF